MKRISLFVLAIITMLSLAACKSKSDETTETKTETKTETTEKKNVTPVEDVTKLSVFTTGQYTIVQKVVSVDEKKTTNNDSTKTDAGTDSEEETTDDSITAEDKTSNLVKKDMEITVAMKDKNQFVMRKTDDQTNMVIIKGDEVLLLDAEAKTYSKTTLTEFKKTEDYKAAGFTIVPSNLSTFTEKTGKETVEGKEYNYQDFSKNGQSYRYYFENGSLKYYKVTNSDGESVLFSITDLKETANNSLFEVPTGYTEVIKEDTTDNSSASEEESTDDSNGSDDETTDDSSGYDEETTDGSSETE